MPEIEQELRTGVIRGFQGGGGVVVVLFEDDSSVYLESSTGGRALSAAFGSVEESIGKEIEYTVDDLGIMVGFNPVGEGVY